MLPIPCGERHRAEQIDQLAQLRSGCRLAGRVGAQHGLKAVVNDHQSSACGLSCTVA
ncbi:hypothetical protein [Novosphingobium sp. THN1]|uniref:hypothetical protein n=1 Tax=Novosphingobium sp. THN1 TaxID=1016987 RepID=UPI00196818D7|nr:hypothetical protein [Novosphingobium sp. THN1]